MAIREYIGARYVPRFMGTYDATQIYEALDVVDNGLGTSYIAKVPTPAGTPLTNTTYWAIYGATSGAIINLQNQIDTINTDLSRLLADWKERETLNDRKFIFISDSYGAMTNMLQDVVSYLGLSADQYAIDARNGYSFVGTGTTMRFVDCLSVAITSFSDPTEVTDIVVVGGLNDSANAYIDTGELLTAMTYFKTYAETNCPNAKIHVGYIGYGDIDSVDLAGRDYLKQYITLGRYINYCGQLGFNYMSNIEFTLHAVPDSLMADGVHPSTSGAALLSAAIVQGIITGSCDIMYTYPLAAVMPLTFNLPSNVSAITGLSFGNYAKHNQQLNFTIGETEITYSYGSAINLMNLETVVTIDNYPMVLLSNINAKAIPCVYQLAYDDGGTKFAICPGVVILGDKTIRFKPYPFINGTNNWLTVTPLSLKIMGGVNITIPTMQC